MPMSEAGDRSSRSLLGPGVRRPALKPSAVPSCLRLDLADDAPPLRRMPGGRMVALSPDQNTVAYLSSLGNAARWEPSCPAPASHVNVPMPTTVTVAGQVPAV